MAALVPVNKGLFLALRGQPESVVRWLGVAASISEAARIPVWLLTPQYEQGVTSGLWRTALIPNKDTSAHTKLEQKVARALEGSSKLAGLFQPNAKVCFANGVEITVDFLWEEGCLALEVDGKEHAQWPKYRADRERDFRMLEAGFWTLRVTNDEVESDLGKVIAKVRSLVELRKEHLSWRNPGSQP